MYAKYYITMHTYLESQLSCDICMYLHATTLQIECNTITPIVLYITILYMPRPRELSNLVNQNLSVLSTYTKGTIKV